MLFRKVYLADERGLGDAESLALDINITKPITCFDIKVQMTTGAGVPAQLAIPAEISNISITDGSFNLVSAIMSALMANQVARGQGKPLNHYDTAATQVNEAFMRISFGRYYGDPEYYLDPTRFSNLQMRLTAAFTIAANNYATGTGVVSIQAHVIQEGAKAYKGVIMTKEIARPTLAANALSQIDLPTDYPYEGITYCLTEATVDPEAVMAREALDVNADEIVIEDYRIEDLMQANIMTDGIVKAHNDVFLNMAVGNGIGTAPAVALLDYYHLFGGVWTKLCDPMSGEYFDPTIYNSFRAQLTGGGTGGQVRVLTNQIYTK